MAKLPPLARTVAVGSTYYRAGDVPPLHHGRKITNPKNWEGGKVPDFDKVEDGDDTATGVTNADAANAQRTGLPGFTMTEGGDTASAESTGAAAVQGDGKGDAANAERNDDPEGTGVAGTGEATEGREQNAAPTDGATPAKATGGARRSRTTS